MPDTSLFDPTAYPTQHKRLTVTCRIDARQHSVYFLRTPAGYLFNGCDDLSGAPSCVECRLRSIELFQQQFPALPLYID